MTAFPAGEEQREFQYKSDCEIYTRTLHGWSRAAMKSSKICPILAHQVFGTVEEFFRGCGSNSERLGRAVTLDHHDPWTTRGSRKSKMASHSAWESPGVLPIRTLHQQGRHK